MLEVNEILNANILIVDDQKVNVTLLEQMLRNAGYLRVTSTIDPQTVCGLHAQHCYDLILLDLQMPLMDGFAVMDGLKAIEPDGYFPVLVITAQPDHKLRALQAGAKDFVSKPFDLIEVQTRIRNMLEVRLLYKKLDHYNKILEQTVLERTAELRESEARFKSFTELSSDWYWEQDALGKFTKISGPVFEMLGFNPDETIGADSDVFASRWNPEEQAILHANIAARRPFLDFVYQRVNNDGSIQYLKVSGEPMFDLASRFAGYRGIGMELTDRQSLETAQKLLRRNNEATEQGVLLIDPELMRAVSVNQTTCSITGYSQPEILALDLAALGLGTQEELRTNFAALAAGEPIVARTVHLAGKDDVKLSVRLTLSALQAGGKPMIAGVISAAQSNH
jgi:PAS domain S-box-containing protein